MKETGCLALTGLQGEEAWSEPRGEDLWGDAPKNVDPYPLNAPGWEKDLPPLVWRRETYSQLVTMKRQVFMLLRPRT